MADIPKPKVKGKLPKWALPVGAVVAVGGVLLLKKKKSEEPIATNATEPGAQGLSNQSFIPVTGENVAGVGASGGGASSVPSGESNTALLTEIIRGDRESNLEQNRINQEWLRSIVGNIGTGGGAPTTPAPVGVVTAPPQNGAVSPPQKAPPTKSPETPTIIKCGNGCQGHKYKSGRTECQVRNKQHQCVWP